MEPETLTEPESIKEIKQDIATYRERIQDDWSNVRSAIDPRDQVEDAIRRNPLPSLGMAALAGIVAGSAFLPAGRRSPIGLVMGGMLTMAYRGFFMAATPVFAMRVADIIAPPHPPRAVSPPTRRGFPPDLSVADSELKGNDPLARRMVSPE